MIDLLIIGIPFQQLNKCSYAGIADLHSTSFQQMWETRVCSPKSLDLNRVFHNCWKLSSYQIGCRLCSRSLRALAVILKSVCFFFREKKQIKNEISVPIKLRISLSEHRFPVAGDQAPDRARRFALCLLLHLLPTAPPVPVVRLHIPCAFPPPVFCGGYGSPLRPGSAAGCRLRRDDSCSVSGSPTPQQIRLLCPFLSSIVHQQYY